MKIPFAQLLGFTKRANFSEAIKSRQWGGSNDPFSDTRGFHTYADLDLASELSAGDDNAAYRNLQILQAFASAADAVGTLSGLRILEVQGQRLHLFWEEDAPTQSMLADHEDACRLFYRLAKQEIGVLAGDTGFTIRMASDYGRAILLFSTGEDVSESIVSLGIPANRPAKKLARLVSNGGVPAGFLAFNRASLTGLEETVDPEWEFIDLDPPVALEKSEEEKSILANREYALMSKSAMVNLSRDFEPNPHNPVHAPLRRSGFMLRADLDNFSSQVRAAMDSGDDAIAELVQNFVQIMQYPVAFKDSLPEGVTVLCFPWAGDCANMFLECDQYTIDRTYLPNSAAVNWHTQNGETGVDWHRVLGDSKWLVAIAGGNHQIAGHGMILTGNVMAGDRTFHVGAGWSWRRSLDAEQSKGTEAEDTVIQIEDHQGLDRRYRQAYRSHPENPTLFKVAALGALQKAEREQAKQVDVSAPAVVPAFNIQVREPRPYCHE